MRYDRTSWNVKQRPRPVAVRASFVLRPEVAVEGKVIIETWQADEVSGSYDVLFEGGLHLSGSFTGPYCGGPFNCG